MISKLFAVASQNDPVDLGFHTLWDRPGCFCWHLMLVYLHKKKCNDSMDERKHQHFLGVMMKKSLATQFWTYFDVWVFKRFRIVLETILPKMD